ncbi:hypothetical protein [Sutterella sp.]|uniref:hypothetical protein n=1 Tax=Sutterella sp. TaxID=1981025 RepID=UPI003FD7B3C5
MNAWSNSFERKWTLIFLFEYIFIMMPFPWFYDTDYIPSFLGVPLFIFGWIIYGAVVITTIIIWWRQCVNRPEYQDDEE